MKKLLILICFFSVVYSKTNAQLLPQLQSIDYAAYYNQSINSLLAILPAGYTLGPVRSRHQSHYACEIWVNYPGDINLEIMVTDFQYINPYSFTWTWDVTLFRKEHIKKVKLYNSTDQCIFGCN